MSAVDTQTDASRLYGLTGSVAWITGGARGLGRSHAVTMASLGCDLALVDVNEEGLKETQGLVRGLGRRCEIFTGGVNDAAFVDRAVSDAAAQLGRIDILINNAGVSGQYLTVEQVEPDLLLLMLSVHVVGAFNCARAIVPVMKRQKSGRIINTASTWGLVGNEVSSHYCAAKAALIGATKAWAKELAPFGICVNAIAPGWIDTNKWTAEKVAMEAKKIPIGRFGKPQEVSAMVAYLASPAGAFISGQVLSLNGAQTII